MNTYQRFLLPLVGIGLFFLIWKAVVEITRPEPNRRPTISFDTAQSGSVSYIIINDKQKQVKNGELSLTTVNESIAALRTAIGEFQPNLGAVPPGTPRTGPLGKIIETARNEFGGSLEMMEIEATPRSGQSPAIARALALQKMRQTDPTWIPDPKESFGALIEMMRTRFDVLPETWGYLKDFEFGEAQLTLLKFNEIFGHSVASLIRIFVGFLLAAAVGVPLGLAMGSFLRLNASLNSIVQTLRPISPIAWLPFASLAMGGGGIGAIFIVFLASVFPIIISAAAAVATLDMKYRRSAMNFGIRGYEFARCVLIPATLPPILVSLRVAFGISWLVVVAAEMLGVDQGLGYLVLDARNQLRYDRVAAAMIVIGVIGLTIDVIFRRFERVTLERRGLGAR